MASEQQPQPRHAVTLINTYHGHHAEEFLLPAGTDVWVVFSASCSTALRLKWKVKGLAIDKLDSAFVTYLANHSIHLCDTEVRFEPSSDTSKPQPSRSN